MASLSLTPEQEQELRRLTRTAVGRVAMRAMMVLWRAAGFTTLEIAALLGCERQSVTPWIDRYQTLGVAGLYDEPRSGRPRHLDAETLDQVEAALEGSPPETDGPCARWTLARLRASFVGRAARAFSMETLRSRLHERGFRWKRPRLWASGKDPEAFEKQLLIEMAKEEASKPAATPEEAIHFCYGDASDQHLVAVLRGMWSRVGQQVRIATPPRNGHWTLFGCLCAGTGSLVWQAFAKAVSESFIAFLEYLLECYPTGQIMLVVDNASYHTSHIVTNWLKAHPRIMLLYLPSHCPQLNPIENIWGALKDEVSANRSFADLLTLGQFIRAFFDNLPPERCLTIAGMQENFREAA